MASSEQRDLRREPRRKEVFVFVTGAADVTISSLHRAFQAPTGWDWIGLDWTGFDLQHVDLQKNVIANKIQGRMKTLQFP